LTFNEMVDTAKVNRDLHAAGLRVDVVARSDRSSKPCLPSSPAEHRRQVAVYQEWEKKAAALNDQIHQWAPG
jgi:hypothetical protein